MRELGMGFTNPVGTGGVLYMCLCFGCGGVGGVGGVGGEWVGGLDITRFCEQQRQPSNGSAWPACPKTVNRAPHCWGRGGSTQFAQQLKSAVTSPSLVNCVVWSLTYFHNHVYRIGIRNQYI